jgi:hypothetical protein
MRCKSWRFIYSDDRGDYLDRGYAHLQGLSSLDYTCSVSFRHHRQVYISYAMIKISPLVGIITE